MRTSFAEASENAFSRMGPRRAHRTLPNAFGMRSGSCETRFWRGLGISRSLLGVSWASLGRSWALLGRLLGALGRLLPGLGRLLGASSLSGTPLTSILGASEANSEGPGAFILKNPASILSKRLHSVPFYSIPLHCIPFHSTPFHSILLRAVAFHSLPFDSIPLPFRSTPFRGSGLSEFWSVGFPTSSLQSASAGCAKRKQF